MEDIQDMYIIVAEQKDNSSEMILNVYDISGDTAENETATENKVKNQNGMLNEVYESLVAYKDDECDNKEGILDLLQNKFKISHDENLLNVAYDESIEIKQELEDAERYMEENIVKDELNSEVLDADTNKDLILDEMSDYGNELENINGLVTVKNDLDEVDSSVPEVLDFKHYEIKLAQSQWLKLRKLLRNEGIMVNTKEEVERQDVEELNSLSNEDMNALLRMIVRQLEQQGPPRIDLDTRPYFLNSNGLFQCQYCPLEQPHESSIQQHYRLTHGPRFLFCLACDSAFRRTAHLVRHEIKCSAVLAPLIRAARDLAKQIGPPTPRNVKVPCQVCSKMIRRSNMQIHLRVHTDEFPFRCSLCPATFRSHNTCKSHERAHSGLRPYKCPHCPRAYTSRTSLQTHKETHEAAGFTCHVCGRSFNRRYTLLKHMDTHTTEHRYLCTLCGRGLSSKAALSNHMRLHSGAPAPHKCTQCGRRFPKVYLLRAHMKKKHGLNIVTRKMFFNFLPQMGTEVTEQPALTEEDCDDPEPCSDPSAIE